MRKRVNYDKKVKRKYEQGKGQGELSGYIPFLNVRDFSSLGRTTRVKGWKTGRVHHLFSDLETYMFYTLEWRDDVKDIREQCPLPLERTLAIAQAMKVKHPQVATYTEGKKRVMTNAVMTTDLLVTVQDAAIEKLIAISVKYLSDLTRRTLEKIEIEKRHYMDLNVEFVLATEKDIPLVLAENVKKLHKKRNIHERLDYSDEKIRKIAKVLTDLVLNNQKPLSDLCLSCDDLLGLRPGDSLSIAYYLIATKKWQIDMNVELEPYKQLRLIGTSLPDSFLV